MVTLANEFISKVARVDVVIINEDDMSYAAELSEKVNLVNLNSARAGRSVFALRRYLKEHRPDVLLSTLGHMSSAAALAFLTLPRSSTRFFIREDLAPFKVPVSQPFAYMVSKVQKWAYGRADGIIALCREMAVEISNHYNISTPVHTVFNPIRVGDIRARSLEPVRPVLPWSADCEFVLGVGRLEKQKDFITLLTAVAEVRKTHELKLVILGEGSERESLQKKAIQLQIEDSLFMPGFVSNPFAFMRASSAYVLSSEREGLPNALIQAQISGAECISTRCPTGPREVLKDGEFGALVDVGDHRAIASEIVSLLNGGPKKTPDTDLLTKSYNPQAIADEYLACFWDNQAPFSSEMNASEYTSL